MHGIRAALRRWLRHTTDGRRCRSVESFVQIGASPLLRHLSAHLVCGYLVSSLLYFSRSRIFAAALSGSATRMRWFSAVHAVSGTLILTLQLLATGAPPDPTPPPHMCR